MRKKTIAFSRHSLCLFGSILVFSLLLNSAKVFAFGETLEGKTRLAGIPTGIIRDIEVIGDTAFVSAENGVFRLLGGIAEKVSYKGDHTLSGTISDAAFDGAGGVWLVEYGAGVFYLDLKTNESVEMFPDARWTKYAWKISDTGRFLVVSLIQGIIVVDKLTKEIQTWANSIGVEKVNNVLSVSSPQDGVVYLVSSEALIKVDTVAQEVFRFNKTDYFNSLSSIDAVAVKDDRVFIGGAEGVYEWSERNKTNIFYPFHSDISLRDKVSVIFVTKTGRVLVGAGGLFELGKKFVKSPSFLAPLLTSEGVFSIVAINELSTGTLLLSSSQLGLITLTETQEAVNLLHFENNVLRRNVTRQGFTENGDVSLQIGDDEYQLNIKSGELNLLNGDYDSKNSCIDFRVKGYAQGLQKPQYFCESWDGQLITTDSPFFYLYQDDGESPSYMLIDESNIGNVIDTISAPHGMKEAFVASSGEIVGYDNHNTIHIQLSKFNWKSISPDEGGWNGITCLLEYMDRYVVCTAGQGIQGLNKKTGELSPSNILKGFQIKFVRGAALTQAGNLWVATNMGLYVRTSSGLEWLLNSTDGIYDSDFEYQSVLVLGDKLLVLGDKYSYLIDEKKILESLEEVRSKKSKVIFTKSIWSSTDSNEYSNYEFGHDETLFLDNDFVELSVEFSTNNYVEHQTQELAFRIIGINEQWKIHPESKAFLSISDIEPGNYTIEAKVSGEGNPVSSINFEVKKPIYLLYPAMIIYAISLFLLFMLFQLGILKKLFISFKKTPLYRQLTRYEITDGESKFEKMLKSKERHISEITHELKTPIQIIQGTLSNVKETTKESDSVLKSIQLNMKRVEQLVNQMQKDTPRASAVSDYFTTYTTENMAHIVNALEPLAKAKRQNLDMRVKGDGTVSLITDSLEKIVVNLVENAIKYTPELGTVKVVFAIEAKTFKITVTDNGAGIAQEQHEHVFERFTRFSNDEKGEGLGLSIVKNLVELNQGEIQLDSKQGGGTKICAVFPIDDTEYINAQSDVQDAAQWQGARKTLLIVDDSREFRTYLFDLLSPKYRCLVAKNGKQAFEVLRTHIVSLVICDQLMGKFDGLSLTKEIREHDSLGATPILMFTASSDPTVEQIALEMKVDYYLMKPSSNQEIEMRIEHLLAIRDTNVQPQKSIDTELFKYGCLSIPEFKTEKDMAFYLNFIAVLENHYQDEEFSRDQAAQALLISPRSLNRRMAELFDYNFSEFLSRYRIEKSIPILLEGSSILNACLDVGFATSAYFSTSFKRIMGIPPKKFVEQRGNTPIQ
ncbi:hybrid sensor histidine kinase/response regulator transcription factor [Alteromonas sp. P256]|uniref:hybrid sensor histidine kinase/response regulator transcription factor n=1 Tax=Alteromonas sp. P256 TaxID=3117399 RepID=UPI002FE11F2F